MLLNELRAGSLRDKERRAGVHGVVEADTRELCPLKEWLERALAQVGRVDGSARVRGEDQIPVVVAVPAPPRP